MIVFICMESENMIQIAQLLICKVYKIEGKWPEQNNTKSQRTSILRSTH